MIKDIRYNGYSAQPSDYDCADGDMAVSLNAVVEDGGLNPVFQPHEVMRMPVEMSNARVVCVHQTTTTKNYIIYDGDSGNLYWRSSDSSTLYPFTFQSNTLNSVTPLGNTLSVLTDDGIHYFLWTTLQGTSTFGYLSLSDELPEIGMSFGLQCSIKRSDQFQVSFIGSAVYSDPHDTSSVVIPKKVVSGGEEAFTNAILAKVNQFLAEEITDKSYFAMPFFVRYAYRLYDGTLTHQSAPILMLPSTGTAPMVCLESSNITQPSELTTGTLYLKVYGAACSLDVKCGSLPHSISDYNDIIQSVDIFVSAPLYQCDPNGKCEEFVLAANDSSEGIYSMGTLDSHYSDATLLAKLKKYNRWRIFDSIAAETGVHHVALMKLPTRTDAYLTEIADTSSFYLLKSIPFRYLAQYSTGRNVVEIDKGYLKTLLQKEVLPDDYDSHDRLIALKGYAYNSRLILGNLSKELFSGYFNVTYAETLLGGFQFDSSTGYVTSVSEQSYNCYRVDRAYVKIKRDGKIYTMEQRPSLFTPYPIVTHTSYYSYVYYYYHPDPNAFEVDLYCSYNGSYYKLTLPLRRHDMLNGAVYFDKFSVQTPGQQSTIDEVASSNLIVKLPNKIYVSEVNNPFYFPVQNIVTVGTGEMIGMAAAAKALSQGQFGQFPLYVFATDGVWALEVSATGTFSARQPITRDVCLSPDSITQLDGSVLFATGRGLMHLSGSQTTCISDPLFREEPFDVVTQLPGVSQMHTMMGHSADGCLPIQPFLKFLDGCQMVYDYENQHIIVFNPELDDYDVAKYTYAYVYSLKSKQWGMMYSQLSSSLQSYPEAMAMTHDGKLVSFSNNRTGNVMAMFVTRALKLGAGDVLKSIHTVIQRGYFANTDVSTVLWGSRDLMHWFLLWSSTNHEIRSIRGSGFKYFRIGGIATLSDSKRVTGASVEFDAKQTNVMR